MSVQTFYRFALWVPLFVPAAVAFVIHGLEWRPTLPFAVTLIQVLLMSGVYGGFPYLLLVGYASWWVDRKPEPVIVRRALQAPLWMIGAWLPIAALFGVLYGRLDTFAGLAAMGMAFSLVLGYVYVAVVFLLRSVISLLGWLPTRRDAAMDVPPGKTTWHGNAS